MAASLPPLPSILKPIQHYLKTATEHDQRDPVVSYYCRFYAAQRGMEIDMRSSDCKVFLMKLMDVLEKDKQAIKEHESMQNDVVAEAHVENYALKLFLYADNEDRAGHFGKNVIKSFYTAGMLMDVLTCFGELSEDLEKNRKYAKWKAAYIHNCLKNGETPHAGPLDGEEGPADRPHDDASGSDQHPYPAAGGGHPKAGGAGGYPPAGGAGGYPPAGGAGGAGGYPPAGGSHPDHSSHLPSTSHLPSPQRHEPHAPASTPVDAPAGHVPANMVSRWQPPPNPTGVHLEPKDFQQAMKFCKYANSALQYEDAKTAIDNLSKALNLLTTGKP